MTMKRIVLALILIFSLAQQAPASSDLIYIIDNVLWELDPTIPYSLAAKELMLLTVAVESDGGTAKLDPKSKSIGYFQITKTTMKETHEWACEQKMLQWKLDQLKEESDMHYQAAIARIYYYRMAPEPTVKFIPDSRWKLTEPSIRKLATLWKNTYNTYLGQGTIDQAIVKYKRWFWNRGEY